MELQKTLETVRFIKFEEAKDVSSILCVPIWLRLMVGQNRRTFSISQFADYVSPGRIPDMPNSKTMGDSFPMQSSNILCNFVAYGHLCFHFLLFYGSSLSHKVLSTLDQIQGFLFLLHLLDLMLTFLSVIQTFFLFPFRSTKNLLFPCPGSVVGSLKAL